MSDTPNVNKIADEAPTLNIDELKAEATELGIKFHPNISAETLAARIEEKYAESAAESQVNVAPDLDEETTAEAKKQDSLINGQTFAEYVNAQRQLANKTRIVTIIDNDSRVNNLTTTCTVNCSNEYFDLGTVILPLNEMVEVRQGHLNVLSELRIPQHTKNPKDPNLSVMVLRPRYTIQYHPEQEAK